MTNLIETILLNEMKSSGPAVLAPPIPDRPVGDEEDELARWPK